MIIGKNIHKHYGNTTVLKGVNLRVNKGDIVAIVGPSGAGKTTLLQILGTLDKPDTREEVELNIDTISLKNLSEKEISEFRNKHIGFIFQFHQLLPEFTAIENLILPQLADGVKTSNAMHRAMELLASVNLENRANHRPAELSGGEQQRVAFCRAMVNSPKLLLADEPTGNLDPDTAMHVFKLLMQLVRKTGMSALIATHNYELSKLMDRQVALQKGQLVEV